MEKFEDSSRLNRDRPIRRIERPASTPQRPSGIDEQLLNVKLASKQERIPLVLELARGPELSSSERRQILLAIQHFVLEPKYGTKEQMVELLGAVIDLASRHDLRVKSLEHFKLVLEILTREEAARLLIEPLTLLLQRLLGAEQTMPFSAQLFVEVGRKLERMNDSESVINVATLGLFFYPFHQVLRELRADHCMTIGRAGAARNDFDALIEQFPHNFEYRLDRAEAALDLEDYEPALDDITAYLSRYPRNADALSRKVECLYSMGRYLDALDEANLLIEVEPARAENFLQRARVFDQMELVDDAQRDAEQALTLEPANQEAKHLRQSVIYRRQNYGIEDDLYSAYSRGDEQLFIGDSRVPEVRFADMGGLEEAKRLIRETIEYPLKYPEISRRYGKTAGGGILLFGPPGCGKTMLAKAAAGECGVNFINVSLASVLDKWVGNTEKAISMIFSAARKKAPSIVFLDEVDALGGSRAGMQTGWEKKVISQLLVELDGITGSNENVMVLGATNAPWEVDFALRRPGRLGRLIFVPPPDEKGREEILKIYLGRKPFFAEDIDNADLARRTEQYSADSLRQIVENAASIPWREAIATGTERPIGMADMLSAVEHTPPDLREWEKLVGRYEEFARQSRQKSVIGFVKGATPPRGNTV